MILFLGITLPYVILLYTLNNERISYIYVVLICLNLLHAYLYKIITVICHALILK